MVAEPITIYRNYGYYEIETDESIDRRLAYEVYRERYLKEFTRQLSEITSSIRGNDVKKKETNFR